MEYTCIKCGKSFISINKSAANKYCSRECFYSGWSRMNGKVSSRKGVKTGPNKKLSEALKGKSPWNKGKKMTNGMVGENHWNWKNGGTRTEREKAMAHMEYREWRRNVFERDNHTCINCGVKNNLHVDHIKPWAFNPELRYDINNGRTLCKSCHMLIGWNNFKHNNPTKLNPEKHAEINREHHSKKIIDNVSGKVYNSIKEAAISMNVNPCVLYNYLGGKRKNHTSLEVL